MTTGVNEQRRARGRAAARRACGRWLRSRPALSAVTSNDLRADLARCTNSATAGDAATDSGETPSDSEGSASGPSENSCSAASLSGVRLVTTIRNVGQRSISVATSGATATICSKLSRSSRVGRSPIRETMPSRSVRSSASLTSSAVASAGRNAAGSETSASVMNARASGNSAARSRPSSISTRVFPTPPGPVIVTTRCVCTRSVRAASSSVRPMSGTAGVGRLLGRLARRSPFPSSALGSGSTKPVADTANSSKGRPTFLSLNRPRGTGMTSLRFLICS